MKRKDAVVDDPTLPFTEIEIGGKKYKMCFDHGALCDAEEALIGQYPEVNLLYALPAFTGWGTRVIFALSLRRFHPEIAYKEALKMVHVGNMLYIAEAIAKTWKDSTPVAEAGDSSGPQ